MTDDFEDYGEGLSEEDEIAMELDSDFERNMNAYGRKLALNQKKMIDSERQKVEKDLMGEIAEEYGLTPQDVQELGMDTWDSYREFRKSQLKAGAEYLTAKKKGKAKKAQPKQPVAQSEETGGLLSVEKATRSKNIDERLAPLKAKADKRSLTEDDELDALMIALTD